MSNSKVARGGLVGWRVVEVGLGASGGWRMVCNACNGL
jgi:hypothetical protein